MRIPARLSSSALSLALAACSWATASPVAHAACLLGNLDPVSGQGNNCTLFDSSSPSLVTLAFSDAKLSGSTIPYRAGARYFQLYPYLAAGIGNYTITDFAWSRDNATWNAFQTGGLTLNTGANPTEIVDAGDALGSPLNIRYTLPAGMTGGSIVDVFFRANNNQSTITLSDPFPLTTAHMCSKPLPSSLVWG
ncbi:MAG: hypothetical protein ACKOZT_09815 [Cyanobium sp.]